MVARQDLRHDLPNADILKTYPLPGWQIVLGEMLAPIAVVTVLDLAARCLTAVLNFDLPPGEVAVFPLGMRAAAAIGLGLLVPFFCAILVLVMNAAVLLFPAWAPQGVARARGIDVMGQRLFFVAGLFLTMAACAAAGRDRRSAVFFMTLWLIGPIAAGALGVLAALIVLGAEIALVIFLLGKRFRALRPLRRAQTLTLP